jgi:hypothetical protein
MGIIVHFDDRTRTGTVEYKDGYDSTGKNKVEGTENLLLQLAIDRAAANTARVSILQTQLQDQSDRINTENWILKKLLNNQPGDPAKQGITLDGVSLTADEVTFLGTAQDSGGATISSYFDTLAAGSAPKLKAGKSFNDLMTAMKSALNQDSNLNQQTMINYQSMINQRNQMTEWVANLITLLASTASATTNNLR